MIHYHNFEQGSDEWFNFRIGKLTASHATEIGANGAGLKTYCRGIVSEINGIERKIISSEDIARGNELEPLARQMYEMTFNEEIKEIGAITNDKYVNVSISPDGLIGDFGGCEIKARNDDKHMSLILGETKEIPINQIQMSLLVSERRWWDFISVNLNYAKPLFVLRIYPDLLYFEKLKKGFEIGNNLIKSYNEQYNNYNLKL